MLADEVTWERLDVHTELFVYVGASRRRYELLSTWEPLWSPDIATLLAPLLLQNKSEFRRGKKVGSPNFQISQVSRQSNPDVHCLIAAFLKGLLKWTEYTW